MCVGVMIESNMTNESNRSLHDVSNVPTFYIMQLEKVLASKGVSLDTCLSSLGLDYESLTCPGATMSGEHFTRLINTIVENHHINDLGLLLGSALQLIHHGPFGLAVMNSPTVMDIVTLFERFIAMRVPALELHVIEEPNNIVVTVHDLYWSSHVHRFFIDALTSALLNLHSSLVNEGNSAVITRITFDYSKSSHNNEFSHDNINQEDTRENMWGIEAHYDQPYCGIVLNKEKAGQPLISSDRVSYDYAVKLCEMERSELVADSVTEKLRRFLRRHQTEMPSLEAAADALYMSKRTLHRSLAKENTSFRKERERTLMRDAVDLLYVRGLSVKQTAYHLGYTEPANFRRAFVNYYGRPPSAFGNQNQR